MKALLIAASLLLPGAAMAADVANGQRLSDTCAVCHGVFGQGASGQLSPRIAGMPKDYLVKAIKDYVKGTRPYALMVYTSKLDQFTDQDIEDVAEYYASLDLHKDAAFNINALIGDAKKGNKIYRRNCRSCHGKDGMGVERKEAPPLAIQHPEYLFTVMEGFRTKLRIHDNDPEDDTFEDFSHQDYYDITAYLATLDDAQIVDGYAFVPPQVKMAKADAELRARPASVQITSIRQTVVKMALEDGVTPEQAAAAMEAKAEAIKLKKVARQRVSRFLEQKGVETPHLSIYQFCNPMDAREMVMENPVFSAYMPCRISVVEDKEGKHWLMMLNLDMLINSQLLPAKVIETATRVNQQMLEVMVAGAKGSAE
ncbi:MAG: c-type cytochrome [Gammaproteobacteria bacterium]